MKVVIFTYEEPQSPTITTAMTYAAMGCDVTLVALYCPKRKIERLTESGVHVDCVLNGPLNECTPKIAKLYLRLITLVFGNTQYFEYKIYPFRGLTWRMLSDKAHQCDLLWVASARSAFFLGDRLLSSRYALHILELYDWETWLLRKYARRAQCVVVPELARAAIHRVWLGLEKTPFVIPNKPFLHQRNKNIDIEDKKLKNIILNNSGKKIVVYQGVLHKERPLECFASVMHEFRDSLTWLIMGEYSPYLETLKHICPNLVYVGYVPAPDHLTVTSYASIGVVQYADESQYSSQSMNNIFCAPNKIWEYSGFRIPAITPDFPSLRYFYDRFHAGEVCNMYDCDSIRAKLAKILKDYDNYMKGCSDMFDSVDLTDLYRQVMQNSCCQRPK